MNLAILIVVAALVRGNAAYACSGYYQLSNSSGQVLKDDVQIPYQLAIDRNTNTLFFSYTTTNEDNIYESVFLNLNDGTSGIIPGIPSGFAHAYDSQDQIVYIGAKDGIYKFDYDSKTAKNLNITNSNILQMFYKNGLYFTTYPERNAFVYKDGNLEGLTELDKEVVHMIAVDKEGSIVFSDEDEVKRVENGKITVLGKHTVMAFNTDVNDNLYFSTPNAIYTVSGTEVRKLVSFYGINGFAIEGIDRLIYAADKSVVRVTLTPEMCRDEEVDNESVNNVQD